VWKVIIKVVKAVRTVSNLNHERDKHQTQSAGVWNVEERNRPRGLRLLGDEAVSGRMRRPRANGRAGRGLCGLLGDEDVGRKGAAIGPRPRGSS